MKPSPTTATYEIVLRTELLAGSSVEDAAAAAGVSRSTAFRWFARNRFELFVAALHGSPAMRFLAAVKPGPRSAARALPSRS